MAAPAEVSPIAHIDPPASLYNFIEPPLLPPFMASALPNDGSNAGQNHDRSRDVELLPPPPPPLQPPSDLTTPQDPTQPALDPAAPVLEQSRSDPEREAESDEASVSEHAESEAGDEQNPPFHWHPIEEDKSEPCEDEMVYIGQRSEHSALDHAYWEKKAFFDLDDPEIFPVATGRIDWLVEHFNGTKENPNKEYLMTSPTVRVGDYDWRIKFYPKGNQSDYLSVYLECVTMESEEFQASREFTHLPLPYLHTHEPLKQHKSEAVQLAIVLYNPAEPRTYEYQCDAHQFTKKSPDYGWTRFTHLSHREFPYRRHGQRQAILRDDKLAFSAYIRILNDPTKCMWAHGSDAYHDSIALTGLRPFATLTPMFAAKLPLLHFAPFREFIYKFRDTKIVFWLQSLLWKMLSRTRSQRYGHPIQAIPADAAAWLNKLSAQLRSETDATAAINLVGTFDPDNGAAIGRNRLKTSHHNSVQAAVDAHPTPIATPVILTLELEREEFDRQERKWNKITNKVEMQNRIVVGGTSYILYSFSTHCGDLESNKFNVYIRPGGPDTLWYAYTNGHVTAMTHKQAVDAHCGFTEFESQKGSQYPGHRHRRYNRFEEMSEVAHIVYYVRDDYKDSLVCTSRSETWDVPESVKQGQPPKEIFTAPEPPSTAYRSGTFDDEEQREIDEHIERVRQDRERELAGAATPSGYIMDGEDVVMSDAEDEPESGEEQTIPPSILQPDVTIECLGRQYYKGPLLGGIYHGEGHLIYMNGDEYIGAFVAGEKSGRGKMIYASTGNIYEGEWAGDKHHGHGTLTEAKTGNVFEGGWKHGKKSGTFVLKGTVTDEDKGCCSICYDKEINTAFYDCGHVLACRECAHKIDQCPVCRRRVVARLELFGVKMVFE